jgi:tetratricopeptide (TPR) repeat protein
MASLSTSRSCFFAAIGLPAPLRRAPHAGPAGRGAIARASAAFVVLALVAAAPHAGLASRAAGSSLDLTVRVSDAATEQPIHYAEVRLSIFARGAYVQRGFTDGTGSIYFTGLERNNHTVTVSHQDYETASETVDIRPGGSLTVSVRLHRKVEASGNGVTNGGANGSVSVARLQVPAAARRQLESGLKQLERDPARAADHFRRALELHPAYAEAHALLGQAIWKQVAADLQVCRTAQGPRRGAQDACSTLEPRAAEAERELIAALELDPELRVALTFLGRLFLETRQFARAEAVLVESRRLDPAAWDAPFELARCYFQMGRLEEALASAEQARNTPGSPPASRLLVVDVLLRMDRGPEAVAELEAFLRDPAARDNPLVPRVRATLEQLKARR